ncbi:MAG: Gfo/Idh/MocA family protein, partial [Verrucomicrobiales bacterium]
MSNKKKLRWGILSTANIGTAKVIPAMQRGELTEVTAISSRNQAAAQAAADSLGIPRAHGSYEALLADPGVDAVYNPLPNHLHVEWSIKALEAGKHVLSEKPIGLNSAEGERLAEAGARHPELKLMEAFMYRHHPQWVMAKQLAQDGGIGTFRTIQSFFSYFNDDPTNIRNMADIGGGALLDIGCYNISLSRFLFDDEPERVCGLVDNDPVMAVDRIASGMLDFGGSRTSTFTCSTQMTPYQRVHIFGTRGRIEIEIPFNAPPDVPCILFRQIGYDSVERIEIPATDQYTVQGDLFARAVIDDQPVP